MLNRKLVKNISYNMLSCIPFKAMLNISKRGMIFPFYHIVSDQISAHTKHLYKTISIKQFETDLDFIMRYYTPASLNDVRECAQKGKMDTKPFFFLSFDDGLRECFEIVMPILKRKGIPAAFFINAAFVDNKNMFHKNKCSLLIEKLNTSNRESINYEIQRILEAGSVATDFLSQKIRTLNYFDAEIINRIANILEVDFELFLQENKPYMTRSQIQDLLEMGFTIGAHSYNHPEFFLLDEDEMKKQVEDCFIFLEDNFGISNRYFAFPFTDDKLGGSFFEFMYRQLNVELSFGTAGLKNDIEPNHFQRIPMEVEGCDGAKKIIRSEYSYYFLKALIGKNRLTREHK